MSKRTIKARFRNGVFEPLDDVNLIEDQEVLLIIAGFATRSTTDNGGLAELAGAWAGQFDDFDQLIRDIYEARDSGSQETPTL